MQNCSPASDEAEDAGCELVGAVHLHRHDRLKQLPDSVLGHLSKGGLGGLVERPLGRVNLAKLTLEKRVVAQFDVHLVIGSILQSHPHSNHLLTSHQPLLARVLKTFPHTRHKGLWHICARSFVPKLNLGVFTCQIKMFEKVRER